MSARKQKSTPAKALANGQVWRMASSDLEIKEVGRLLVRYKMLRKDGRKTVTTMSAMRVVSDYLAANRAVLIQG